ncbi:hypothetical protein [Pseudomonas sp.]|uniref:hypothetical protein n=1 Tax=Pseudomonas sp. TaxID=306 RepID=UPI001A02A6E9|nr:hypothetical protein [Pseudomonas sp.]MBF0675547.1 hypothetical protein [Pseudomonas sp.]
MKDQKMVKVPHELLDRWADKLNGSDSAGYGWEDLLSAEIRAILARPVADEQTEQQPVAWVEVKDRHEGPYEFHGIELLDSGKHYLYAAPIAQTEQKPVAFVNFHEMEACLHKPSSVEWIPVYTAPIAQTAPSQPEQSGLVEAVVSRADELSFAITHALSDKQYAKISKQFAQLQDALAALSAKGEQS